jgi:hypothetical protein
MAITVQLVKQLQANGDETIDLSTGGNNIYIANWVPGRAEQDESGNWLDVSESIALDIDGSSHDNLATILQPLDEMLADSVKYPNRSFASETQVWLQSKLDNETGTRQALVKRGRTQPTTDLNRPPTSPGNFIPGYQLGLVRHPFWEDNSATTVSIASGTATNTVGGTATTETTIPGDVPARVLQCDIDAFGTVATALTEFWLGWRSNRYGDLADFEPNWDLGAAGADHYNNSARATGVSDTINSQIARWTPAGGSDDDMLPRVVLKMEDLISAPNEVDQIGSFKALLRAKATASGDAFRVRLAWGYYTGNTANAKWDTKRKVAVPYTSGFVGWRYYDLGTVSIPPGLVQTGPLGNPDLGDLSMMIEAERSATAGGGNLELDTVTLIPQNEGAIYLGGANVESTNTNSAVIWTSPDDHVAAETDVSTYSTRMIESSPHNWFAPAGVTGTVMLVVAAQRSDASSTADDVQFDIDVVSRFLTLRGGE